MPGSKSLHEIKTVQMPAPSLRAVRAVLEDAIAQGSDATPILTSAYQHLTSAKTAQMDSEDAVRIMSDVMRHTAEVMRELIMPQAAKLEEATGAKPIASEALKDLIAEIDAVTAAWTEPSAPSPDQPQSPVRSPRRRTF